MKRQLLNRLRRPSRRANILLLLLLVIWSLLIGLGLSVMLSTNNGAIAQSKAVDVISEKAQSSQQVYLNNCASCHIPIPPELLPTQRWAEILENPEQHFGVNLRDSSRRRDDQPPLTNIDIRLMWEYVQQASRVYRNEDVLPSRLQDSRFFTALHPKVGALCAQGELPCPQRLSIQTCITCHTAAQQFDYSQLTPEWDNSP